MRNDRPTVRDRRAEDEAINGFGRAGITAGAVLITVAAAVVASSALRQVADGTGPPTDLVSVIAVHASATAPGQDLPPGPIVQVTVPVLGDEPLSVEPRVTLFPGAEPAPDRPNTTAVARLPNSRTPHPEPSANGQPARSKPSSLALPSGLGWSSRHARPGGRSGPATPTGPTVSTPTKAAAPVAVNLPARYRHPLGWVSGGKVVSLTFDDGPSAYTGRVLDVLDRYGVKATFCQIGEQVRSFSSVEKRIASGGDTFCDHTWTHDETLPSRSVRVIDSEIDRTQQAVELITGVTPRYYRAPGGDFGKTVRLRVELAKFHTIPLAWADDSLDWTTPGVAKIVDNVVGGVSPGAIILMHDGGGNRSQTLAALPKIITGLRAAGYDFVVLPRDPPD